MKARIVVSLGIIIFFTIIGLFLFKEGVLPVNPQDKNPRIFVVRNGEEVREIAGRLKKEGLIRDPITFFLLVRLGGVAQNIQAGDFRLNPSMDAKTIAQALTHGTLDVWITTLEGWRNEEIALKLAQDLAIPEGEFLKFAKEGYMFPDTYLLPREATAGAIVNIIRQNFEKRWKEGIEEIDEPRNQLSKNVTKDEVITLASIVEREAKLETDRPKVAGILLKRLDRDWPLQTDATIQYALGYQSEERTWWKKNLTKEDLGIKSPYNTYKNPGLPPGPICNPGLEALKAVVWPEDSAYWFYLSDRDGQMHYAETIEEHNQNIERYLNSGD